MDERIVYVVDDDEGVRDSIKELVESVGLHAEGFATGAEFLKVLNPERSGCLVLDIRMPEMSGIVLQRRLNELEVRLPVIMLTGHGDVPIAVEAMKAGAFDFLQKPYREQALLDSINAALSEDAASRVADVASEELNRRLATLTKREAEVLDHVLSGETSRQMAEKMGMSPRTAETHRHNLLQKLGAGTIRQLLLRMPPET